MKVIGKRVYLSEKEIRESVESNKRFKKFVEENNLGPDDPLFALIQIMKFLKSGGWDFSKKGESIEK